MTSYIFYNLWKPGPLLEGFVIVKALAHRHRIHDPLPPLGSWRPIYDVYLRGRWARLLSKERDRDNLEVRAASDSDEQVVEAVS
jgi:hypothetical protein